MNDIKRFLNQSLACYGAIVMGVIGIIVLLSMIGFVGGFFGAVGNPSISGLTGSISDALSMVGLIKILSWLALILGIYMVICSLYALLANKEKSKFWIVLLVSNIYCLYSNFRATQFFGLLDDGFSGASKPSSYYSSLLEMSTDDIKTMVLMILVGMILMYVVGLVIGSYMYFHKVPLPGFIRNVGHKNTNAQPVSDTGWTSTDTKVETHAKDALFCPQCGAPITSGQKFCVKCGYALEASQEGSDTHE